MRDAVAGVAWRPVGSLVLLGGPRAAEDVAALTRAFPTAVASRRAG